MNNPFSPPNAKLECEEIEQAAPAAVILAIRLLWGTMALSLIVTAPALQTTYSQESSDPSIWVLLGVSIFSAAIFSALVICIGKRQSWARWVLLGLSILSWVSNAIDPSSLIDQGKLAVVAELIIASVEICVFKLLFFGEGALWFKPSH